MGAVFARDLLGYFSSPAGYVFITLFVLVCSWAEFWQPAFFAKDLANLDPLNEWMPYLLLVFVPAITMSVWAEERRQGTDELLLTLPARDVEVVLGKYLAAFGIFLVALLFLAVGHFPLLAYLGRPDPGILTATYLGYALMGALLIAIGMVASAISTNATVAYILGALFCAIPVFASGLGPIGQMLADLPLVGPLFGGGTASGEVAGLGIARLFDALSVPTQFRDFGAGVIPLAGLIYFLGLAGAMLYLNMVLLGRRHWKGGRASKGRWVHAVTRVTAVVVALVSLYAMADRWANARVDATAEGLHTLSDATKRIVREIPEDRPIYVQAFFSPEVPREFVEVKTNLINTLKEFAALGGGRISLNLVETRAYTAQAREAEERFGIASRRVAQSINGRQRAAEPIYLGVAFTSGLEQVVIPFFDRGLSVEYELARSVRVVTGSERKRVGILQTDAKIQGALDPMQMTQEPDWEFVEELKKQYDVTPVSPDAPIPMAEVQTLSAGGEPTGGTFTLGFGDERTAPLPLAATNSEITKALEALGAIEPGRVIPDGGPLPSSAIALTFAGFPSGEKIPELTVESKLEGGERPTIRVGTTQRALDALIVAQPSSLTEPQIANLRGYIRAGGPTLMLMDPFPITNPILSPSEPKPPATPMMGLDSAPKGDLTPLLAMIGVSWPSDLILWDTYNPYPELPFPEEYIFIGEGSDAPAPFAIDPITKGLQGVLMLYAGQLRKAAGAGPGLEFETLMQSGSLGGTVAFEDMLTTGPFGNIQFARNPTRFPTGENSTLAARVQGTLAHSEGLDVPVSEAPEGPPVHVILIADLDMISDALFDVRRRVTEAYDRYNFDNVTFVLNCVDVLAGDDSFLELRKKRPKHRTLERIERESERYIRRSQEERKAAEREAEDALKSAQDRLTEAVDAIRESDEFDLRTKESLVRNRQQVEERRLALSKAEIEGQKEAQIRESRIRQEEAISSIENRVRALAVVLPPLPALILGGVVFFLRSARENRGANPDRLA